ncbi:MAG: VOC family protein [Treponema sp.]|jgi:catechol 2,3-dioxygenase-like lactoylglutathione lyase family enzyme|nr:VOC family protein [Treponema sp.]
MAGVIGTSTITQVALVVRDIEKTKKKFAAFLGQELPATIDGGKYEVTGTVVYGKAAPEANCLMAFFNIGPAVQLELIQPNGVESCWQDFLDQHGEGLHHIAFGVKNMDEKIKAGEDFGLRCVQRGKYGSGSGEYAYLDGQKDLKCFIELLENY